MEKFLFTSGGYDQEIANVLDTCVYGDVQGSLKDLLRSMFVTADEKDTVFCKLHTN